LQDGLEKHLCNPDNNSMVQFRAVTYKNCWHGKYY